MCTKIIAHREGNCGLVAHFIEEGRVHFPSVYGKPFCLFSLVFYCYMIHYFPMCISLLWPKGTDTSDRFAWDQSKQVLVMERVKSQVFSAPLRIFNISLNITNIQAYC